MLTHTFIQGTAGIGQISHKTGQRCEISYFPQKVVSTANIHSPSWGGSWFHGKTAEGNRRLEGIQISTRDLLHFMPQVQ